jgi:hypothetical protein
MTLTGSSHGSTLHLAQAQATGLQCGLMGLWAGPKGKSLPSLAHGLELTACVLGPLISGFSRQSFTVEFH